MRKGEREKENEERREDEKKGERTRDRESSCSVQPPYEVPD